MANLVDQFELDGLREDFFQLLGAFDEGGDERSISKAKTLGTFRRILEDGPLNPSTHLYDSPIIEVIYAGPIYIGPVTYRRDRQELGGGESVRIRQYRCMTPFDAGDFHLDDYLVVNFWSDVDMEGRVFDVTDVLYESELSARRLSLVDTKKDLTGLEC